MPSVMRFGFSAVVFFCICITNVSAVPSTPAVISILDSVVVSDVEPLGANIGTVMGGTNYATNQFISGGGFEPGYIRWLRRVDRCGTNWVEWDGDGGIHLWDMDSTGFGNGATIRIYRIVNAAGQPLAWSTGGSMTTNTGADHVILVGEYTVPMPGASFSKGGWIAKGSAGDTNRVYLDRSATLHRGDYLFINIKKFDLKRSEINGRLYQYNANIESAGNLTKPGAWNAKLVAHPGTPLPQAMIDEDPGESCYELSPTDNSRQTVGEYMFHAFDAGEGQWYGVLTPGASYRCEVWLRQEGLGNSGRVRFGSNQSYSAISQTWTVTGTWTKYTYDFTGPAYPSSDAWHHMFLFEVTGPGKVWIDNWKVFQNDAAHENRAFSPCTLGYNEYLRTITPFGKKPSARFYPLTFPTEGTIDRQLSDWTNSSINFIYNMGNGPSVTIPHALHWCLKSGNSPQTRIVPFFTQRVEWTEADWKALVEYLGVPYDPATDTPQSKPYAYLRYKQRGSIGTPWTDEFREIVIEYGNESWHNGAGGYGWYGFSQSGAVWQGGLEYGLFAHYMFDQQVGGMPAWTQYNLGNKIKFALSGGYMVGANEYGEVSVRKTTGSVKYVTHANYVGPKWETGDVGDSIFNDDGIQRTLVAADPDFKANYLAKHAQFRDEAKALGVNYDLIVYEGGPSGYAIPGSSSAAKVEVAEQYGKSTAMAVAALDSWLYSSYVGYKHQNYLGYGCGTAWSSHTQATQGGFRQHTGWMAMAMRNNYARGDQMLRLNFTSAPTYTDAVVSDSAIPLVSAYCLRDAAKKVYSVFVLSRKAAGTHSNGTIFGDGFTPVTLNLPFTRQPQSISLYRLARRDGSWTNPTLNNRDSLRVVIRKDVIAPSAWAQSFVLNAATGADAKGLPPGNIFLYVFALDTTALSIINKERRVDDVMAEAVRIANQGPAPEAAQTVRSTGVAQERIAVTTASGSLLPEISLNSTPDRTLRQPQSVPVYKPTPITEKMQMARQATGSPLPASLAIVSVSASSLDRMNRPANTVDGKASTRWAPKEGGYQWITYDLGRPQDVSAVAALSYCKKNSPGSSMVVLTSLDAEKWTLAWRDMIGGRGTQRQTCPFVTRKARYVRVSVDSKAPVSFSEVGIYAQPQDAVASK